MYDYPLAKTQIIWEPDDKSLPPIEIVMIGSEDDLRYSASWGACNQDFSEASTDEKVNMLMKQFVHLAVNEKIAPEKIHQAFLQIPEYRRALADHGALDPSEV